MNSRTVQQVQGALGVTALLWTLFLLPATSFIWWIAGNAVYGGLALAAATVLSSPSYRHAKQSLVIVATLIFAVSNGTAAFMACTTGGACGLVVAVMGVILPGQLAVARVRQAPAVAHVRDCRGR